MARHEFPAKVRAAAFERADGRCERIHPDGTRCVVKLQVGKFRYDHVLPDWLGGEPTLENCACVCLGCDAPKTAADQTRIAKTKRQHLKHIGARPRSRMPGSKASGWKKGFDGRAVRRNTAGGYSDV